MDKLAINWQNFTRVGLQLKFTFTGECGRKTGKLNLHIDSSRLHSYIDILLKKLPIFMQFLLAILASVNVLNRLISSLELFSRILL